MKIKVLAAAVAMGVTALLPTTAMAATGGLYWSPDGGPEQSSALTNPQSGRCYTLPGSKPPFYAINTTQQTMHYYRSPGCSGELGTLVHQASGNVTRYVKFD